MAQFITGKGDITNPASWQEIVSGIVPPPEYQNVPNNQNYPLNGDGRYWWSGDAASPFTSSGLLLHMDNTGTPGTFLDSSGNNLALTATATAVQEGTTKKFGVGGGAFPAIDLNNPDKVTTPIVIGGPIDLTSGNPNFTIESWFYVTALGGTDTTGHTYIQQTLYQGDDARLNSSNPPPGPHGTVAYINSSGTLNVGYQDNLTFGSWSHQTTVTTGAWHHFAVVRNGLHLDVYLDGVKNTAGITLPSQNFFNPPSGAGYFSIGSEAQFHAIRGYMDEFRITKGTAVYTANFTPATSAFNSLSAKAIQFIGDPALLVAGTMALEWQITQYSTDGSIPYLQYSLDGGNTVTQTQLGSGNAPQSGSINVPLAGALGIQLGVVMLGGAIVVGAPTTNVAIDITRNVNTTPEYNYPDTFNPINYNASRLDLSGFPSATLAALRQRLLIGLGFAAQAANPPPSMAAFCNDKLLGAQNFLYRRYPALHTRRFFRWQIVPGQRFYSLKDNDEDVLSTYHMDPLKTIEWAGIQDTRNVWYPMIEGIPPQLYTMISKPWRPARYDIRQAIEIYPAPDQTYWLWIRANFGLLSFVSDSDTTTLDSELVFLEALALAKAHYGQPDAQNYAQMANTYRGELIAGTHKTAHYIPGTIAVPPAVRPTLIQFTGGGSG